MISSKHFLIAYRLEWSASAATLSGSKQFQELPTPLFNSIMEVWPLLRCVLQFLHDQKLCELEKKFEECFANEERQLLQKVVEMLASSSARKKKLRYWQEDAHEFFQSVLDRLHSFYVDLKLQDEPSSSHANSFINQIFGGHLRSQTYSYK